MVSDKALQELKEVFRLEKGYIPEEQELVLYATQLLTLMNHVFKPIKKEWVQKHDRRNPN
jgi:hypothetical protein